jgi:hypothetical protein
MRLAGGRRNPELHPITGFRGKHGMTNDGKIDFFQYRHGW